jgi:hypothetical protein
MPATRSAVWVPFALCAFILSGCGENAPRLVPVTGKAFQGNEPLVGVIVKFVSDLSNGNQGHSAQATAGTDGSFTLETYPYGQGVMPGRYKVIFLYYSRNDMLPRKYTKFHLTPLVVEVKEGGDNNFVFNLEPHTPH